MILIQKQVKHYSESISKPFQKEVQFQEHIFEKETPTALLAALPGADAHDPQQPEIAEFFLKLNETRILQAQKLKQQGELLLDGRKAVKFQVGEGFLE